MKKIKLFIGLGLVVLCASCTQNSTPVYSSKPAVYFDYTQRGDSVNYSFQIKRVSEDTVWLNVKLLGALLSENKTLALSVVQDSTTAIAGTHYQALANAYAFSANQSVQRIPIVIFNKELDDKSVTLYLKLSATDDLDIAYPELSTIKLIFTNEIIEPYYWNATQGLNLERYFGEYSLVKHKQCIEMMGHDFPLQQSELNDNHPYTVTYWMIAGREVCSYYANNTVYDENGNLIEVWNPF